MQIPSRLLAAFGTSILLHGFALAVLGTRSMTPARPGTLETIEVALTALAPMRVAATQPAQNHRLATPMPDNRQTNPLLSDSLNGADSPLVEARHDVAGLDNPKPPYPLSARRRGLQGRVLIAAHVRADGHCDAVQIRQSSGHAPLDDSARDTVRRWRFLPARRGDTPTDSWVEVPIVFRLDS